MRTFPSKSPYLPYLLTPLTYTVVYQFQWLWPYLRITRQNYWVQFLIPFSSDPMKTDMALNMVLRQCKLNSLISLECENSFILGINCCSTDDVYRPISVRLGPGPDLGGGFPGFRKPPPLPYACTFSKRNKAKKQPLDPARGPMRPPGPPAETPPYDWLGPALWPDDSHCNTWF